MLTAKVLRKWTNDYMKRTNLNVVKRYNVTHIYITNNIFINNKIFTFKLVHTHDVIIVIEKTWSGSKNKIRSYRELYFWLGFK